MFVHSDRIHYDKKAGHEIIRLKVSVSHNSNNNSASSGIASLFAYFVFVPPVLKY